MEALQLEIRVKKLEEDVLELKKYKDECIKSSNETKTGLAVAVQKIEYLITSVEKLPKSLEESMLKSIEIQKKENEKIYYDIKELKKDGNKMQSEITALKKLIDERTVEEDSDNYKQIKLFVITTILGSVIGFIVGLFLK